jgi:hypothetical protein
MRIVIGIAIGIVLESSVLLVIDRTACRPYWQWCVYFDLTHGLALGASFNENNYVDSKLLK